MPRRPAPSKPARKTVPEELARDATAHEEAVGGKVHMTFRVILSRQQAEGSLLGQSGKRRTSGRWSPRFWRRLPRVTPASDSPVVRSLLAAPPRPS